MDHPFITIGMPALNEAKYIEAAIRSILPADRAVACELIVVDGGSTDATQDIVCRLAESDGRIRLFNNTRRSQAAGINLIASLADPRSAVLVRADCHAAYPENYVRICVDALLSQGATSVVVPMRTVGTTCAQRAIACAQNSLIGNGGAAHRRPGRPSCGIDHGHHAAFVLADFRRLGGYDEALLANEDAELDSRIIASGGRIWLCGEATILYYPRASLRALGAQYARYGAGRATTLRKARARPRARQILPVVASTMCAFSLALGLVDARCTAVAAAYYLSCLSWGVVLAVRERTRCSGAAGVAAIVMHHAFAIGFLGNVAAAQLLRAPRQVAWAGAPADPERLS